MSTNIEWTDHTLNPGIYGCQEVSPACANCYAAAMARRLAGMGQGAYEGVARQGGWTGEVRVDFDRIKPAFDALPKRKPARVFVTSMSDLFHPDVPASFIDRVFREMEARPHLTFQVLTKRPEHMVSWWRWTDGDFAWPTNVWAGTTVEDQRRADERIPELLKVPAAVRFLSCEPLLGPIDISRYTEEPDLVPCCGMGGCEFCDGTGQAAVRGVGWVIAGGESGPKARPSHPDWFRSLKEQCQAAGVPYFFKQWGEWVPYTHADQDGRKKVSMGADGLADPMDDANWHVRVGKKAAGRLLDGRTWDEFPEGQP